MCACRQPESMMLSVILNSLAAWMLYSFMMVALFSIGLLFYYLFKDVRRFGIHLWAWFM